MKDYSVRKIPNKNCLQKGPGDEKVTVLTLNSRMTKKPMIMWGIIFQGIGSNYTGTKNSVIVSGKEVKCQNWNALLPHRSMFLENEDNNYCRNPNNDPRVGFYQSTLTRTNFKQNLRDHGATQPRQIRKLHIVIFHRVKKIRIRLSKTKFQFGWLKKRNQHRECGIKTFEVRPFKMKFVLTDLKILRENIIMS